MANHRNGHRNKSPQFQPHHICRMSSSPYEPAAKLLNQIWKQRKGLKTLAYSRQGELICSKTTYAQCAKVLQCKPVLDRLIKSVEISARNEGLLYVLLYELLLGPNKKIRGGGALKQEVVKNEGPLKEELERIRKSGGEIESLLTDNSVSSSRVTIPRYIRVNTLQTTSEEIIKDLKSKGVRVYIDAHVPDVLVVPPTPQTRSALQDLVASQKIILQDKSSCFSALCLVHGFDTRLTDIGYIDACAAPGNKTSHLASLISKEKSSIHALDRSPDRYSMLRRRMKELVGEGAVHCHNLDFLESSSQGKKTQTSDFDNIRAILLDPSCSGSGMTDNHHEAMRDPNFVNDRVKTLSDFQLKALKHATCSVAFPMVQRVVYSTCSLYIQENEGVVERFLKEHGNEWTLVAPKCLEAWKRRGLQIEGLAKNQSDSLIRVHPDHDASNGFFVACFEKMEQTTSNNRNRNEWKGVSSVGGISVYMDNFDPSPNLDNQTNRPQKRKVSEEMTEVACGEMKSDEVQKVPSNDTYDASVKRTKRSKKIAKKQEWKRKQRERKEARLLSNQGMISGKDEKS